MAGQGEERQGQETKSEDSRIWEGDLRTKELVLSFSLASLDPSGLGSRKTPTPWPVRVVFRGGQGSYLSTNSTRETRGTSGASGTL